jgi:superfamily II DNA or RNA helicase
VEDAPQGFRLRLSPNPEVTETLPGGIVLVNDELHPEGEPKLSGRERHELTQGRIFRYEELGELVGAVLPSLQKRLLLDIRTNKLPSAVREPPRMSLLCKREGDSLYVLPRVVYGDPPRARVEGERLVSLGGEVPLRDLEAERTLEERFRKELGLRVGRGEELSTENAIDFVEKLEVFEGHLEGEGRESFRSYPELTAHLSILENDFELEFETAGKRADPQAVLRAWHQGSSLVQLNDGGYAPLPLDWLASYGDRLSDLLAARDAAGDLPQAALPDLAHLCEDLGASPPPHFEKLQILVNEFDAIPEAPLPEKLHSQLRDYQRHGVNWLVFLKRAGLGALLADDMGLGKTFQALCAIQGKSLVAAPTSVLRNWVEEARRFRPELSLSLYHGPGRTIDPDADLVVTSHALLRLDQEALGAVEWDTVIIDEAQAIRNPDTDLARAAYSLPSHFRVSLTGTPIENRLIDLWSQLHFLNPGFLGGLSDFEDRYVRPIELGENEPLERLRERIRPFFLRRLKSEVAPELPPRTEITLYSELSDPEREVYETVRLAARRDVLAKLEAKGNVLAALEALLRLRQAACHSALVPGQEATTSSKSELLLTSLETAAAEGHKSLVFSQWTSMLDLLEPHMKARDLPFLRLDGSTRDRGSVVERFQNDEGTSVFLISLKAGGTGLNLTAADHVFLFDPWWNPAVEEQAFDRAHRIGQEKPVFVHRLVTSNTVEERILALQEEKRALADMATGRAPAALTRDDLLRLLD